MDAIELLLERQSDARLIAPGPNAEQLAIIQQAALKAPDHGALAPWRFIVVEGEGLTRLGELFYQAAVKEGQDERTLSRAKELPLRAPMVIIAIAKTQPEHSKVPVLEQIESAACATMAMQQAAFAQGLGAIWRTGHFAVSPTVKAALKAHEHDEIVGYLYIGTPELTVKKTARRDPNAFFENF
ncbi:NAD(P)H nitroreductase [Pseudoalteromonas fenneropenaei]|uniref:Putative NAD(P)H nitroreductase n=1 Tax=Pseudoalteromonas fenneropenaei TaxID=1737459 RepID=A0ABV7CFG2_9GAMM